MELKGVIRTVCFCGILLSFPSLAFAQDAAAEALFRSAQQAVQGGDWETACARFLESNRLDPAPGTVLNLARCSEELGRLASAWKYYKEVEEKLAEADPRAHYAANKVAELQPRVPTIQFITPQGEDSELAFELIVNGTRYKMATLGVALPFDPGEIHIQVEADGHDPHIVTLDLAEGENISHQIQLGPLQAEPRHPTSNTKKTGGQRALTIASFAVGGVGAAAAVFGGIWAGVELGTVNDPQHCLNGSCDQTGADASSRGRTAVVLLGTGAAVCAIGVGLGTFLLLKNDEQEVALRPLPGGAMFSFGGNLPALFGDQKL